MRARAASLSLLTNAPDCTCACVWVGARAACFKGAAGQAEVYSAVQRSAVQRSLYVFLKLPNSWLRAAY